MAQKPPPKTAAPPGDDFTALASKKVALDLDNAPFLQEEEPDTPAPPPEPEPQREEPKPKRGNKKLIIIIAAAVLLLLILGLAAWFFFLRDKPEPEPERPIIVVTAPEPAPAQPPIFTTTMEPFVIPLLDADNNRHFLEVTFVIITDNPLLYLEIEDNMVTIRDSVFYYLNNQSYEYMRDPFNAPEIKTSLIRSINDYLLTADIDDIYYDAFLIR